MSDLSSQTYAGPALELDGVFKEFEDRDGNVHSVLRDVSLKIAPGELLAVVGKSGCGKTTVLNLVAGLIPPTSGKVSVLGEAPEQARPRTGYMFARDALLPWRKAVNNVMLGLELRGMSRAERRERAQTHLDAVGLGDAAHKYPVQLSQGMRQRVALARTWALGAELLLMDEPFAALDAQTRASVQAEFLSTWERNKISVLFITHDLTEAVFLADRVVVLNRGQVQRDVVIPFSRPRKLHELQRDTDFRDLLVSLTADLDLGAA